MAVTRRRRWCAAMLAVMLVLVAVPVGAQSELDTARANARAAAEAADEARARAQRARQRADDAIDQLEHAIGELEELEVRIRVVELNADAAAAEREELRAAVEDLADVFRLC